MEAGGIGGKRRPSPIVKYYEELDVCPAKVTKPQSSGIHKWAKVKSLMENNQYREILRCRKCLCHVFVDLKWEGDSEPVKKMRFVKNVQFEVESSQ